MGARRSAAAACLIVAGFAFVGAPAGVAAESPSPSVDPGVEPHEERPAIQAWLDQPIPTNLRPGDQLEIGATIWDATAGAIAPMRFGIFLRAVPSDAASEPARATGISDWPGHVHGSLVVPPSGLREVEVGVTGTVCENEVCAPSDWTFELAGSGPPPDAPITSLADARIGVGAAAVAAGRPADLSIVLTPKADWSDLPLPDAVVVRVREARGPNVATASLPLVDPAGRAYAGSITIPRAGELVLEAATDADGGDATRFGTSMLPLAVTDADEEAGEGGVTGSSAEEGLPLIALGLMVVVAVVGAGVILASFRTSGR